MNYNDLTDVQKAAVDQKGSILVSAAAGSGKTAVLVQRLIKELTDKESRISADRLLVVSFTVAAAGEMRSRLEKGLEEYCRENPADTFAARQKLLLQSAKICTIDSFCIEMVRENFAKAGVSPDFKIAEDKDVILMSEKAISSVFEKYFESENQEFLNLLDAFGSFYDEKNLADAVKEIYEESQYMPFPEKWMDYMQSLYNEDAFELWSERAFNQAEKYISKAQRLLDAACGFLDSDEKVKTNYGPSVFGAAGDVLLIRKAIENRDWNKTYSLCGSFKFGDFKGFKGAGENSNAASVKSIRDMAKATVAKVTSLFDCDCDEAKAKFITNAAPGKMLMTIAKEYLKAYEEIKKENGIYTFNDIEHLAFELICKPGSDGITLTEDAAEYIANYDEVLVDEYQDVNDLQDAFFYYLSDMGKHLFAVGDVKQSIYGFRGANPENFINKINKAVPYSTANESDLKSIILDANFRSSKDVCGFVNFIFDQLMTKENCSISYKDTERLSPQAKFPAIDLPGAEVHLVDTGGFHEKEIEAVHIADCIEEIMNSGEVIKDKDSGNLRKAKYSDFAVIVRALKGNDSYITAEFKRRSIPVSYAKDGFMTAFEIKMILSLLCVIDNPTREIELLSTLMSPLFGFTPDDMADVRCADKKSGLYSAVIACAANGNEKCKEFLKTVSDFRNAAVILPLPKLISKIYDTTNILNIVCMMSDGQARKANLLRLVEIASSFSASGNNNVGYFLKSLNKLPSGKIKGATVSGGSDSVKIISIHHSKGLQFPICFFSFTGSKFNTSDQTGSLIIDPKYGISFKYFDKEEGGVTTVDKKLMAAYSLNSMLKEELRMFYVAATRAEDRLIVTMAKKNPVAELNKAKVKLLASDNKIGEDIYFSAVGYIDWILPCMLLHPESGVFRKEAEYSGGFVECDGRVHVDIYNTVKNEVIDAPQIMESADTAACDKIKEILSYEYPFDALRKISAKASVSDITHKAEIGEYDFTSRPGFLNDSGFTPTGRGTAVHKIMQYMDFAAAREDFDKEIERLTEWEFVSEAQANVDTIHIRRFTRSELFDRILAARKVEREMKFLTFMPAYKIGILPENLKDEQIVVQGAVDLMFEEADGIVIVDFKTDRVKDEKQLIKAYSEQLNIYAQACEKITGMKVKEKIIYSLVLDRAIVV